MYAIDCLSNRINQRLMLINRNRLPPRAICQAVQRFFLLTANAGNCTPVEVGSIMQSINSSTRRLYRCSYSPTSSSSSCLTSAYPVLQTPIVLDFLLIDDRVSINRAVVDDWAFAG